MTTVRMPVRIRLDLDPGQVDPHLLDLAREAAATATGRAIEAVRAADQLAGAVWSARPPEVGVRFTGDQAPDWAVAQLEAGARQVVQNAATRLRVGTGPGHAPKNASLTVTPIAMTTRLARLDLSDDLFAALAVRFAGGPIPPRLLVMAADRDGVGWMVLVEPGPDGTPTAQILHQLAEFVLMPEGHDREITPGYSGWRADTLSFVAHVGDQETYFRTLVQLIFRGLRSRRPGVPEKRLLEQARQKAEGYRWTKAMTLYEFTYAGASTNWYRSYRELPLTGTSIPVVILTEEAEAQPRAGRNSPPLTLSLTDPPADPGQAFLHELSLEDWDPDEFAQFSDLIEIICDELGTPRPRFVGSFILSALPLIGLRCEAVGGWRGTEGRQSVLEDLVRALQALNVLMFAYTHAMLSRDRAGRLPAPLAGQSVVWATHLHRAYFPLRHEAVAALFVASCQDTLLEYLEKSGELIAARLQNSDWLPATRLVFTVLLADLPELDRLRTVLRQARELDLSRSESRSYHSINGVEVLKEPVGAWSGPGPGPVRTTFRVRDAKGDWRTLQQVEAEFTQLRSEAIGTDPFVEKLADLPEIVTRVTLAQRLHRLPGGLGDPLSAQVSDAVDRELFAVLREIRQLNRDRTWEVRNDRSIAYGLATFAPDAKNGAGVQLSGVHALADQRLRKLFSNNRIAAPGAVHGIGDGRLQDLFSDQEPYVAGLRILARRSMGKDSFKEFANLVGLSMLAVFFPGVALVVGLVQAGEGLATAYDHADLQRSMLGGDAILSRAQVEAELVSARLQALLAFAPVLPGVAKGSVAGARALARGELSETAAVAFRAELQAIAARLAQATVEQLTASFLAQVASGYVLNLALSWAIGEFARSVAAEYGTGGTVPREQLEAYVRSLMQAAVDQAAPTDPDPS
jgi:hypothetical protein